MRKCIYAETATGCTYPSFINVSELEDGRVQFSVRGEAILVETESMNYFNSGHQALTCIHKEDAVQLAEAILKHFAEPPVFSPMEEDGVRRQIVQEDVQSVGELQHTRRLVIESYLSEPLHAQVARLAKAIMENFDDEPSESAGAVDTAIRLLEEYSSLLHARKMLDAGREKASRDLIAQGLAAGQAEPSIGESARTTTENSFVNAGTRAVPFDGDQLQTGLVKATRAPTCEVAHPDGSNEPAEQSAPLGGTLYYPDERAYDVVSPQPSRDDDILF